MITPSNTPVRSIETVKPAGAEAPKKPEIQGKSNPAVGIKNPAIKEQKVKAEKTLKSASEIKNPVQGKPVQLSTGKTSHEFTAGKTIPAKELFIKTAANMGFPKDALSVALLVFARYFSVSLSPDLMKTLRREILASGKSSSPETQAEKSELEAETLSSLIALDKGVELSPQALEHYARFFSFPERNPSRQDEKGDLDRDRGQEESPEAEELRILTEQQGQNDDVLALLNQLPGKNGQRWLVFPFSVKVKGIELQVFLRLLKKEPVFVGEDGHLHLIVDISGPKKQWRCFLNKAGEEFLADLRVYPRQSPRAIKKLQKEAEQILKEGRVLFGSFKGFDEIVVRNGEETASWADDLCTESLPSIDEEI